MKFFSLVHFSVRTARKFSRLLQALEAALILLPQPASLNLRQIGQKGAAELCDSNHTAPPR